MSAEYVYVQCSEVLVQSFMLQLWRRTSTLSTLDNVHRNSWRHNRASRPSWCCVGAIEWSYSSRIKWSSRFRRLYDVSSEGVYYNGSLENVIRFNFVSFSTDLQHHREGSGEIRTYRATSRPLDRDSAQNTHLLYMYVTATDRAVNQPTFDVLVVQSFAWRTWTTSYTTACFMGTVVFMLSIFFL